MPSRVNIDPNGPQAFLSYTRFDDIYLGGAIRRLHDDIEMDVRYNSGQLF